MDSAAAPSHAESKDPSLESTAPKHGPSDDGAAVDAAEEPPAKKTRLDESESAPTPAPASNGHVDGRRRGIAPVKAEYVPFPLPLSAPYYYKACSSGLGSKRANLVDFLFSRKAQHTSPKQAPTITPNPPPTRNARTKRKIATRRNPLVRTLTAYSCGRKMHEPSVRPGFSALSSPRRSVGLRRSVGSSMTCACI